MQDRVKRSQFLLKVPYVFRIIMHNGGSDARCHRNRE